MLYDRYGDTPLDACLGKIKLRDDFEGIFQFDKEDMLYKMNQVNKTMA